MKNRIVVLAALVACSFAATNATAATEWSTQEYDLYPGDFDGDGKTDLLYVAKDPSKASGIARSDGNGPNLQFQSWPSNHLGIPWHGNLYNVLVADFSGDGKSDLFLQRKTPGDHFLLHADANGKFTGISQTVAQAWSADQYKLHAGDFNGGGKADLFLQANTPSGTNSVVLADANGWFTSAATQSWTDASWSSFRWSVRNSNVFIGDFNGDGRKDLLLQAKPNITLIDYEITIPVPTYPPNANGVVLSQGGATPFQQVGVQQWNRNAHGVDWSPNAANIIVGDFDGNGRDDVVLQARNTGRSSYLLSGNASGAAFTSGTALATNVTWSSDSYRLLAGNFDGGSAVGVYFQAQSSGGTNYYANVATGGSVSVTTHNPSAATGVVPVTAVGHTLGSFAVSDSGSATYSIPIVVPPGVAGVQPSLSINYGSGNGNGALGVGWGLDGLSEVSRCNKTIVQDNATEPVTLTSSDRFCLDGNKLRLISGTYGAASSTYQTELETFSKVTASGTAGNGPAYFTVEAKDGLTYEYGATADSRIESLNPAASTTPRVWALNKVTDPHGNSMSITYQEDAAPNGSYRPTEILYTSNATAGLTGAYKVTFVWDQRPDVLSGYVAGGFVKENYRLNRIETRHYNAGWQLVRKYQLSYNTSGSTPRSRLTAIQECDRNGACLAPTMISWQDGVAGWSGTDVTSSSGSAALMEYSYPIDVNGDGRDDLVYPESVSGTVRWHFMMANASGGFDGPFNTGINAGDSTNYQYAKAQPIDYFSEGRMGLLVDIPGMSTRQILRWNGSTLALTNTSLTIALAGKEWVADFDGDGRLDVLSAQAVSGTGYLYVYRNTGTVTSGAVQFSSAQQFYSASLSGATWAPFSGEYADLLSRLIDFNGDGRGDFVYSSTSGGCSEMLCLWTTTWTALTSTGSSFTPVLTWTCQRMGSSSCELNPLVADFNGDGLADIVTQAGQFQSITRQIHYGTGSGLSAATAVTLPAGFANGFTDDYDGDGRTDILYRPSGSNWSVVRFTDAGFDSGTPISLNIAGSDSIRLLDFDGDDLRDVGYKNTQFRVRKHNGKVPDYVSAITDGFGNSVSIQYAPLTDATVYTRGPEATFPDVTLEQPFYVVKQYSATDGTGGSYTVSESYKGARSHLQGRGFLGFSSRTTVDGRTGVKSVSTFFQDYPYIGMVDQASVYQPNGTTLIAQTTNTPAMLVLSSAAYNERKFPYVQQSVEKRYEVGGTSDGQQITQVTTTAALDSYGNPTTVTTSAVQSGTSSVYSTETVNTYDTPDAHCWWRGFVTRRQVTNTVPGSTAQTRTTDFEKDPAKLTACRVHRQIVEPNDNAVKVTTTFGYDAFGHPTSETVAAANITDRETTTSFGAEGVFPRQVTNALNQSASKTYDYALGVPKTATDPNGLTVTLDYDGFGRVTQETRPDGTKTAFIYSACTISNGYCGDNRLRFQVEKRELDTGGGVIRSSRELFDALGRALYSQSQTLSGAFANVATNYDSQGRPYQQSQPYFTGFPAYFTTISYDLLGRPTQEQRRISEANSAPQTTIYSYDKLTHGQTDANNKTTTKLFNAIGQIVRVTDAASGITQYEYDQFGNLKKTTDPAGNQIVNSFNIRGFKESANDPDMGAWSYTYYPTGELWTQTDAKGQPVTFTYDKLSRPLTRTEPEGTTTFLYGTSANDHNIGKLQSVSSPGAYSQSYTYDSLGRLQDAMTNADATSFVVSNTYNATTGFLEAVTYPTSTAAVSGSRFKVKYEYDYGLLKRTRDFHSPSTIYWEQVATNAAGQAIDEVYGNGLHTYSNYDGITGLLATRTAGGSSQIQNLAYQWDKVGNLTQRKDSVQSPTVLTEDFSYDNLYRLDDVKLNNVQTLKMKYDATGNIDEKNESAVTAYNYTTAQSGCSYYAHSQPHAVRRVGAAVYCYDANGNMTRRAGSDITWYSYNLPNRVDNGNSYSQFYYGADRARYKQIAHTAPGGSLPQGTETTIYVGALFEKVTKPSGVIEYKHHILSGSEPVAIRTLRTNAVNDTRYLHKDHLGSVDAITNESGGVVQRLSYDAFGKRRNAAAWSGALSAGDWASIAALTHRGYTFHEGLDNVDLIHMNGRVYDPNIARFISADPFVQAPLMSQSLNRYSYVMNNPLSLVDPSGYSWLSKQWKKFKRWVSRQWESFKRDLNAVVGFALIIIGSVIPGAQPLIGVGVAILNSPVRFYRGRDGMYATLGYSGFSVVDSREPTGVGSVGSGAPPPPMTAPAGAISLVATGAAEAFSAIKRWFSVTPSTFIHWENPEDRNANDAQGNSLHKKIATAMDVAIAHHLDNLPPMGRGFMVTVTAGGSGWERAHGFYDHASKLGRISFTGASAKFAATQTEMNSLAIHEIQHVIDTHGYGLRATWTDEDVARWHGKIYRMQWDLRKDPKFFLDPKREYYRHILNSCVEYGGGCRE